MTDDQTVFFAIFDRMTRQGPGSAASTRAMFDAIPAGETIANVLDVGCGKGAASLALAEWTGATVTAIDVHQPFLDHLADEAARRGLGDRIRALNKSMTDMDFAPGAFDLIWAEGSAYFLGVEKAFTAWRTLLRPLGYLFLNDAVWATESPTPECRAFWEAEYPEIGPLETRLEQARAAGYTVLASGIQPKADWDAYTADMETQVAWAREAFGPSATLDTLTREIHIQRRFGDEYGYGGMVLQRTD